MCVTCTTDAICCASHKLGYNDCRLRRHGLVGMHITFVFVTVRLLFVFLKCLLLFPSYHWPISWHSITVFKACADSNANRHCVQQFKHFNCAEPDNAYRVWPTGGGAGVATAPVNRPSSRHWDSAIVSAKVANKWNDKWPIVPTSSVMFWCVYTEAAKSAYLYSKCFIKERTKTLADYKNYIFIGEWTHYLLITLIYP